MRIAISLLLAACVAPTAPTSPTTGSRGPRADDHLAAARAHEQRSAELALWPDTRRAMTGFDDASTGLWYRRWDTVDEQKRLATIHRGEAARLQARYEEACGSRPLSEVSVSPLQRFGVGGANTENGVLVFLDPSAGSADELMASLRCHRAWMMLGNAGMADCPLDLEGLEVVAHGNERGITVALTIRNARLVSELQRRAARDLELSTRR